MKILTSLFSGGRMPDDQPATQQPDELQNSAEKVAAYWTAHNVTSHHTFTTEEESLEYVAWRNDQYFNYIQLMPVSGQDGRDVLDYGCGPGNDLVGFGTASKPRRLVGVDVSASSLHEASLRMNLHNIPCELYELHPSTTRLPFDDESFDHVHCSGVLHHTPDPMQILKELRRVLRRGGTMNIMVYNYDSLWVHLYVAYQRAIVEGLYSDLNIKAQFTKSTDGDGCPISNCYRSDEWLAICHSAGLSGRFTGSAISMHEMTLFHKRFDAIQDRRLRPESRRFLLELTQDEYGLPKYRGHYAGVDGCYQLTRD